MKKLSVFTSALAFAAASMFGTPGSVAAEWNDPGSVNPGKVEVAFLEVGPGGVYVNFRTSPFATVSCTSGNFGAVVWWKIGGDADTVNKVLSLLLAAKLSGTKLKVYRPEANQTRCTGGGTYGYALLTSVTAG